MLQNYLERGKATNNIYFPLIFCNGMKMLFAADHKNPRTSFGAATNNIINESAYYN